MGPISSSLMLTFYITGFGIQILVHGLYQSEHYLTEKEKL
jgi:hypothetical protein